MMSKGKTVKNATQK